MTCRPSEACSPASSALAVRDDKTALDVERLARAIDREIHIDAEHGFPPQVDAHYLANAIADHYEHDTALAVRDDEEPRT